MVKLIGAAKPHNMKLKKIPSYASWSRLVQEYADAKNFLLRLPNIDRTEIESVDREGDSIVVKICSFLNRLSSTNTNDKTLVVLGPMYLLPYAYHSVNENYHFKNLIALRLSRPISSEAFLPNEHFGAAVFKTSKNKSMNVVRKPYQHCKCCGNTVKDYGGKTHIMDARGARVTDVWTDITMNRNNAFPPDAVKRLFEMIRDDDPIFYAYSLGMKTACNEGNRLTPAILDKVAPETREAISVENEPHLDGILNTDVIEGLQSIPDDTIDFALVDPPYNISVKYGHSSDNLDSAVYLDWCKRWVDEVVRTLKPGGVLASVNIPRWTLEMFPYMQQKLSFRGWIVWDAFSYPSSRIIPAHYPILCFGKKTTGSIRSVRYQADQKKHADVLSPLNFGYCIRSTCLRTRTSEMSSDKKHLSDLWTDIHRVRHNSFRYSHPTLMPQRLARRLVLLFSNEGDVVLDCFNGVGTTTLVASSLNRRFVGIENDPGYFGTSLERHEILDASGDPFARKIAKSTSSAKGYRKRRAQSQVKKRVLQMEVKRVADILGRCPSQSELKKMGKYSLKIYFDNFEDWAEITVATRRTGIDKKGQMLAVDR